MLIEPAAAEAEALLPPIYNVEVLEGPLEQSEEDYLKTLD